MGESKGCAKALRRVTRGGADSKSSPGRAPSNMRDCVATKRNLTQSAERTQSELRRIGTHKECKNGRAAAGAYAKKEYYFFAAAVLAAASAYFLVKRSTRPAVSINFCLPVKKGWQFEQISTRSVSPLMVERVVKLWPQAQCTVTG